MISNINAKAFSRLVLAASLGIVSLLSTSVRGQAPAGSPATQLPENGPGPAARPLRSPVEKPAPSASLSRARIFQQLKK